MSLKINRGGIMAMEGLESKIESALQEEAVSADAKAAGAEPGAVTEGTALATDTTGAEGNPAPEGAAGAPAAEDTPVQGGEAGTSEAGSTAPSGDGAAEQVGGQATPVATGTVANVEDAPAAAGSGNAIVELDVKVPDTDVETHILGMEEIFNDMEQTADRLDVAQGVDETVDGINEQLQASIDDNEGFAPGAARALEVSVDRMKADVGFGENDKVVWPALENFGGKKSKVEGTKDALHHNQQFQLRLRKGMAIAQEGLGDKIGNAISSFFATEDKLLARLEQVSAAYDAGTPGQDPIQAPAWGKAVNLEGKSKVTGADVANLLAKLQKTGSNQIAPIVAKAIELQNQITLEIINPKLIASSKTVEEIHSLAEELKGLLTQLPSSAQGKDASFAPVQPAEKQKILAATQALLSDKVLRQAASKLKDSKASAEYAKGWSNRLAGPFADDVKAAGRARDTTSRILTAALGALKTNVRAAHGALAYVGASVRKGAPAAAK